MMCLHEGSWGRHSPSGQREDRVAAVARVSCMVLLARKHQRDGTAQRDDAQRVHCCCLRTAFQTDVLVLKLFHMMRL